jgi:hypothetical protein
MHPQTFSSCFLRALQPKHGFTERSVDTSGCRWICCACSTPVQRAFK